MTEEGDNASDERLLFGEKREQQTLYVGSGLGITEVDIAAGQVGQFSLATRCTVRDLAADGTVLAATDEAVLCGSAESFEPLGFGPAVAVSLDGQYYYAADEDRIARRERDATAETDGSWETIATGLDARDIDGCYAGTATGCYLLDTPEPRGLGLSDVRAIGNDEQGLLAGTASGLYRYDGPPAEEREKVPEESGKVAKETGKEREGWKKELSGEVSALETAGSTAVGIVDGAVYEHTGEWEPVEFPTEARPVALAGDPLAVLTEDGSIHVRTHPAQTHDGYGGWRSQSLGLPDPCAVVIVS